jgi:hypothetical protein
MCLMPIAANCVELAEEVKAYARGEAEPLLAWLKLEFDTHASVSVPLLDYWTEQLESLRTFAL